MTHKILISFLGKGAYSNARYSLNNDISDKTMFVQEALVQLICNNWNSDDRICIYCTEQSFSYNWQECDHEDRNRHITTHCLGLCKTLENRFTKSNQVSIPNLQKTDIIPLGNTEAENWSIFSTVYNDIANWKSEGSSDDKYEIYLDITHSFRSIPFLASTLLNFTRFMANIQIKQIYYGAFEASDKKDDEGIPIAQIVQLNNVIKLQDYTDKADSLLRFGRMDSLGDLLSTGENKQESLLSQIGKSIKDLDEYIILGKFDEIKCGSYMASLESIKEMNLSIHQDNIDYPTFMLIQKLYGLLFDVFHFKAEETIDNIQAAVKWAFHYHMLPQAYMLGQEYLIDCLTVKLQSLNPYKKGKGEKARYKNFRQFVLSALRIPKNNDGTYTYQRPLTDHTDLANYLLSADNDQFCSLRKSYQSYKSNRNLIAHAWTERKDKNIDYSKLDYSTLEAQFSLYYYDCLDKIKNYSINAN